MAYDALDTAEVAVGKPVTSTLLTKVKDNFDWLYGQLGILNVGVGIPNGSFEADTDADGDADNWTISDYAGGTHGLSTVHAVHGLQSLYFTHPGGAGNGGGYAHSDYLDIDVQRALTVTFSYYATAACKVIVQVRWYDVDQIYLSSTTLLSTTSHAAGWSRVGGEPVWPVANARYARIELVGGYTDTNVAGTVYFDHIRVDQVGSRITLGCHGTTGISTTEYYTPFGVPLISGQESYGIPMMRGGRVVATYLYTYADGYSFTMTLRKNGSDVGTAYSTTSGLVDQAVDYAFADQMAIKVVNASGTYALKFFLGIAYMLAVE